MIRLIIINDPHLAATAPPSRLDEDYRATILGKIRKALEIAKSVGAVAIFTGDIFHNKHGRLVPHGLVGELSDILRSSGVASYGIVGNHDIIWDDPASINTQPIGNLFRTGALVHLTMDKPVVLTDDKLTVELYGMDYSPARLFRPDGYTVGTPEPRTARVLAVHAPFYKPGSTFFGDGVNLDMIKPSSVDILVCGHIHSDEVGLMQDDTQPNPKFLLNFGALSRGTSHTYNFQRRVVVTELQLEATETSFKSSVFLHDVGALPAEEVLRTTPTEQILTTGINITQFLNELRTAGASEIVYDPDSVIAAYTSKLPSEVSAKVNHYIEISRAHDQEAA